MKDAKIAIIGSGFAGVGAAIELKRKGFENIVIFEKEGSLGGTWRDNTYPGAACDVMSHLYSFSFFPNPNWSKKYSPQKEIIDYLEDAANHFGVTKYLKVNTRIDAVTFDEDSGVWHLTDQHGARYEADIVISALGQLNKPDIPDMLGLSGFKGRYFHSARFDHQVNLKNKNVSVIGNAASAVQLIPEVAKIAKKLNIFQRTPNWIIPRPDREFSEFEKNLFRKFPFINRLYRWYLYFWHEVKWPAFINGTLASRKARSLALRYLNASIKDEELRKVLTPDYPVGCKRILLTSDYFPTLMRDNVNLVTSPIDHFTEDSIVTKDGESHKSEVVIFATGFKTTEFLTPMEVIGRNGLNLNKFWADGPEAYLGIVVPNFPNCYMLYGPNTNLAHNSIIFMLECQIRFVIACLKYQVKNSIGALEIDEEANKAYNRRIQNLMKKTVWVSGCPSWYKNEKGKVVNNWPRSTLSYYVSTKFVDFSRFKKINW